MHKLSCSVVMASYNGEKSILRQLESLRLQTCAPEEVLILDDCSSDNTLKMVQKYIDDYRLPHWTVLTNERNIGWKENFYRGMCRAKGDILFLCDQDDEWDAGKTDRMLSVMEEQEQISVLACDYSIDYGSNSVSMKKYKKKRTEKEKEVTRYLFSSRFFQNPSPGCTYAVRKSFVDGVKDYWFSAAPHDEFLWLLAAEEDRAWFLNETLMTVHRAEGNASDIRYKDIDMQKKNLEYIAAMLERMEQRAADAPKCVPVNHLNHIIRAKTWCGKRRQLMETRNPLRWLAMAPYWRYYNSWKNCLSDLYLVLFGSFSRN